MLRLWGYSNHNVASLALHAPSRPSERVAIARVAKCSRDDHPADDSSVANAAARVQRRGKAIAIGPELVSIFHEHRLSLRRTVQLSVSRTVQQIIWTGSLQCRGVL